MDHILRLSYLFAVVVLLLAVLYPTVSNAEAGHAVEGINSNIDVPPVIVTPDRDPLEGLNRAVFGLNNNVDSVFLAPFARAYRDLIPDYGKERVENALQNLSEPSVFLNNLFQGDLKGAMRTFWRFFFNSTFGIAGMYDFAGEHAGLKYTKRDFGMTLAKYGFESGSYVVLPILNSSSPRNIFGLAVDGVLNPLNYTGLYSIFTRKGIEAIHIREGYIDILDDVEETSFDPYATIRSAYIQRRAEEVRRGIE